MQKGKSVSFYNFFLFKCKMPITNIVKTCLHLVVGKWKAFCMKTRIPSPSIILVPTNTSTLYYGLILIQPISRVIVTNSTATNSMVTATSSMVTEPKSMILFRLQVHSQKSSLVLFKPANTIHPCKNTIHPCRNMGQ